MDNVFKQAGFKIGDAFVVTSEDAHHFPIDSAVLLDSFGLFEDMAIFSCSGLPFTQALRPDQLKPLASPAANTNSGGLVHTSNPFDVPTDDEAAAILATLLPVPEAQPLTDTLLSQPLPYPLSTHFKMVDSIGELFESMPLAYVRQCIEQMPFTPFERATMLALLAQYQEN